MVSCPTFLSVWLINTIITHTIRSLSPSVRHTIINYPSSSPSLYLPLTPICLDSSPFYHYFPSFWIFSFASLLSHCMRTHRCVSFFVFLTVSCTTHLVFAKEGITCDLNLSLSCGIFKLPISASFKMPSRPKIEDSSGVLLSTWGQQHFYSLYTRI